MGVLEGLAPKQEQLGSLQFLSLHGPTLGDADTCRGATVCGGSRVVKGLSDTGFVVREFCVFPPAS
uniref:Uncharacterized protein n=1 Tax=Arion vulgaris TaxID=1028688 RepID=A0A0B7A7U1_9EUPU